MTNQQDKTTVRATYRCPECDVVLIMAENGVCTTSTIMTNSYEEEEDWD